MDMKPKVVMPVERCLSGARRVMLHTSAACFGMDFTHSLMGHAMILAETWERIHEPCLSYSAFAAVVIVYIDGHKERLRECHEDKEVNHEIAHLEGEDKGTEPLVPHLTSSLVTEGS